MIYREATIDDLAGLAELRWALRTEHEEEPPVVGQPEFLQRCVEWLRDRIGGDGWTYWVAEDAGVIVANMFVQRIEKVPRPGRLYDELGYLTNVYTRPEYRDRGIGSALLNRVIEWAREVDLELLVLWPSDRSVRFYERAGFQGENDILELPLR